MSCEILLRRVGDGVIVASLPGSLSTFLPEGAVVRDRKGAEWVISSKPTITEQFNANPFGAGSFSACVSYMVRPAGSVHGLECSFIYTLQGMPEYQALYVLPPGKERDRLLADATKAYLAQPAMVRPLVLSGSHGDAVYLDPEGRPTFCGARCEILKIWEVAS